MKHLDKNFWDNRYLEKNTGWDIGYVSTPIKEYVDQLNNKELEVLIPGAGFAFEAQYLYENGFNVSVLDISEMALDNFKKRLPDFPTSRIIHADFFEHSALYDLILEQTFFCALSPELRPRYIEKMHELLKVNGKLAGLLFNFPLSENGPPFGGSLSEYKELFSSKFTLKLMEDCNNSIPPRKGSEYFFIAQKNGTGSKHQVPQKS